MVYDQSSEEIRVKPDYVNLFGHSASIPSTMLNAKLLAWVTLRNHARAPRRPRSGRLHYDEAGALQMFDEALRHDLGRDLVGVVNAPELKAPPGFAPDRH